MRASQVISGLFSTLFLSGSVAALAQAGPAVRALPMCASNQLSLATDQENGSFDGMSHGGTLVVLRNIGSSACRLSPIPQITFADATHDLAAKGEMQGTRFMHPGPVVLPIVVPAGAEVTATLRWVSGEVYEHSLCITPTKLTVKTGEASQTVPFAAHLCGEQAKGVNYQMTRFATDPVYSPQTNEKGTATPGVK